MEFLNFLALRANFMLEDMVQ